MYGATGGRAVPHGHAELPGAGCRRWHEFITGNVSGKSAYPEPLDYGSELFNSPLLLDRQVNGTAGHPLPQLRLRAAARTTSTRPPSTPSPGRATLAGETSSSAASSTAFCRSSTRTPACSSTTSTCSRAVEEGCSETERTPSGAATPAGIEAYASLTNGAFFHDDDAGLWVNNYIASTVSWEEQGLQLRLDTDFPDSGSVKMAVTLAAVEAPRAQPAHPVLGCGRRGHAAR